MSDQSESSRLRVLFEAALDNYKEQTGIELAEHPLAERLQDCDSVESVTDVLSEQAQAFKKFREKDKFMKPLKKVLTVLYNLSPAAGLSHYVGLHLPPVKAIQTGLGVLLSAVKGIIDDYDALVNLLESIGNFLNRLEIYTKIPPTDGMNEMIVKILVELLSTLALATKQMKTGNFKKLVGKLVGEKKMEAMAQRLDRLTQDEARQAIAQILDVVHGLVQNTKVVMEDGKTSIDYLTDVLKSMHQVASDLNKSKRDSLQQDIFKWLSPPDSWNNHHNACKLRHSESAAWFVQGKTFSEWKASEDRSSLLWVYGKPGAGKSVLCSTIIEDIDAMRKAGLASLAFFYYDFREDKKKDLRGLLSSLLVQLCHQYDSYCNILSNFYSDHAKGLRSPREDALRRCLKDLLICPGLPPVYLITDALDECPNPSAVRSPRAEVLHLIKKLIQSQIPNLRICVTSRPETDIKDVLGRLAFRSVSLHDENGQKRDIEGYIKWAINTLPKKGRWKAEDKKQVIDVFSKHADGMFRWVDCQVVYICDCIPARIRHALAKLPGTLDETYERTLREINNANWEFAHRMFQFVAVASRPLMVEELAELLAFDFKSEEGSMPKFYTDWRLENPQEVLSLCSSLLTIVDHGHSPVIQFSHFSVKEFLTSTRLANAADVTSRRYHVSMTPAHALAAKACLGILLHLNEDVVTRDGPENFPLAIYAAEHWVHHAQFEDVSRIVEDGMKQLFNPRESHLAVCLWIYDPCGSYYPYNQYVPRRKRNLQAERPFPPLRAPLHYAASWGLHSIIEFLVSDHSQDVHCRDFINCSTPLHLASKNGHVEAARILIERGADMTAEDNDGESPLHLALHQENVEVARMLIERGTAVAARNKVGDTPLHLALRQTEMEVARMLIERGASMTAQNGVGETPFHRVLRHGEVDVARMFIEHGADMAAQNDDGETMLHLASRHGQMDFVRMLIASEHGADITTAQNKDGKTPFHLALDHGQVEVARMFIEHGVDMIAHNRDGGTVTPGLGISRSAKRKQESA